MGQEVGHAYEDLLEATLESLLPVIARSHKLRLRLSQSRRLSGVSGNIDHLLEIQNSHDAWEPYLLFMEKHSDSADESHKSFRRHLEEFVQAKKAYSSMAVGSSKSLPVRVCNLIYGTKAGWKPVIIEESKRLLDPTIFLPDQPFYFKLQNIIDQTISAAAKPYRREKIKNALLKAVSGQVCFLQFITLIRKLITQQPERPSKWLVGELERSTSRSAYDVESLPSTYARKALTELCILTPSQQQAAASFLQGTGQLTSKNGLTPADFRSFQLASSHSTIQAGILGPTVRLSPAMHSLPSTMPIQRTLDFVSALLFGNANTHGMKSSDYLAYFDVGEPYFIDAVRDSLTVLTKLIQGNADPLIDHLQRLTPKPAKVVTAPSRNVTRCQNIFLECCMGILSVAAEVCVGTRTDCSTSTLARYSSLSESAVNRCRGSRITNPLVARSIADGLRRFIQSLHVPNGTLLTFMKKQKAKIDSWATWNLDGSLVVPDVLSPNVTMSPIWARHNQLNSHSVFNPLTALCLRWVLREINKDTVLYGFPRGRSANPIVLVRGDEYTGLDFEFSIVTWDKKSRRLSVYETSSVIDLKHTSDKCKELAAKMRVVRSMLHGHCSFSSWLMVDGDWTNEHCSDLSSAGWDEVIFSREFLCKTLYGVSGQE